MERMSEGENMSMRKLLGCWVVAVCLVNLWGCGTTQPTHFYLLRAIEAPVGSLIREAGQPGMSLGLGPINIPKYLERPQIVTRVSPHEIELAEFHKWGAPLKENVSHVLEENLSELLNTEKIVMYPWNRSKMPDYQLSLDIIQFDGMNNQEAVFKVRWSLAKGERRAVFHKKTSQFSEIPRGADYEALVEAMSRMLTAFSQEVADVLKVYSPSTGKIPPSRMKEATPLK